MPALYATAALSVGCGRVAFDQNASNDPTIDAALDAVACPTTYQRICGGCYTLHDVDFMWGQAESTCEGEGTHLVVPDTDVEHSCLLQAAGMPIRMWIGVTDLRTLGTFSAVTGGAQMYLPWAPGLPDSELGHNCVEYRVEGWANENCTDVNRFYCESDGIPVDPTAF